MNQKEKTSISQGKSKVMSVLLLYLFTFLPLWADDISPDVMQRIYDEVKTPYKYGMVVAPADNYHKIDCPTVFREGNRWLMTYVVYNGKDGLDGRGYETWLAESDDLLAWRTLGRLLSYKDDGWDMNQRGGFPSLIDWTWDGSYNINRYKGRYWMTYIGGHGMDRGRCCHGPRMAIGPEAPHEHRRQGRAVVGKAGAIQEHHL